MKMISRTKTTSTKGVILISEREVCVLPLGAVKAIVHLVIERLVERPIKRAAIGWGSEISALNP